MPEATLGVFGRSAKENERRLPIHPRQLHHIAAPLRRRIWLEHGYGRDFGVSDEQLATLVAGLATQEELVAGSDILLLPKPTLADVTAMREGQVLWGWPHCVQDPALTQVAIDKRLTLIAWEAMNHWGEDGDFHLHVFHRNNELAGYCSVLQAMVLRGFSASYGRPRCAAVIGFGNTARGAVHALQSLGVADVVVLTMRDVVAVADPIPGATLAHMVRSETEPTRTEVIRSGANIPTSQFLAGFDIIVNCVLQDTDAPIMFIDDDDLATVLHQDRLVVETLIVDVSCDAGMGFSFARPTSFEDPMFTVGDGIHYYGVDHSPSYLWESATAENSAALLPHLPAVMAGPAGWDGSQTVRRAIEIRDGIVQNPKILSFQHRSPDYPHPIGP